MHSIPLFLLLLFPSTGSKLTALIIEGRDASVAEVPFQALVTISQEDEEDSYCGGVIIHSRWLLTAGHCFKDPQNQQVSINVGIDDLNKVSPEAAIKGDLIKMHPHFSADGNHSKNDIALIKTSSDLTLNTNTSCAITLSTKEIPIGSRALVTGFGHTSENGTKLSAKSQLATVKVQNDSECQKVYKEGYNSTIMLCAGVKKGGPDACQGDSGGPLFQKSLSGVLLIGITSFGEGCGRSETYGIYTRVSQFFDWIHKTTNGSVFENDQRGPFVCEI